jgi:integrase
MIALVCAARRTSPGAGKQRAYVATTEQVWARCTTRCRPGCARRSCSARSPACGAPRRAALRTADVDFMRGAVHPAVQYPAEPLKTEISRTPVPIPRSLALELAAHVQRRPGEETVLTGRDGGQLPPWALERAIRTARGKVDGLPSGFRYHDLRHYFGSLLIASGADVKTVQARLRHASAKTTLDTYGHLRPGRDESTRAAVDAVLAARAEQARNGDVAQ